MSVVRTRKRTIIESIVALLVLAVVVVLTQTRLGHYATYNLTNNEGRRTGAEISVAYRPADQSAAGDVPIRLAVAGDVGTGGAAEQATADAINRIEEFGEYDALLLLGDNAYPSGDPAELKAKVLDPFADVLDGGTQLLPVLGNHDDGFGDEQVAAFGLPGRWYSTVVGDVLIVSLDSNRPGDIDQLKWLDETLTERRQRWTIVEMHHPPYSGGWHGSDRDVRAAFGPLFERHRVDLVLTGHDHDYQRTQQISGVTYVVSGAAAKRRAANLADFTEVAMSRYHFTDITIWNDRLVLRAVDQNGRVFDEATLTPNTLTGMSE